MPVLKVCKICNKEFKVPPVREHSAHTCSQPCRGKYLSKIGSEKKNVCNCLSCGKEIKIQSSRLARGNGKYCSIACKNKFQTGIKLKHKSVNGEIFKRSDGYIYEVCTDHPFVSKKVYVLQHRLRMEERMRSEVPNHHFLTEIDGIKYLKRNIHVHHKNEVKDCNDIENLVACTSSGHRDIHAGKITMFGEVWPVPKETIKAEARYVEVSCAKCSQLFITKRSKAVKNIKNYCSINCRTIHRLSAKKVCLNCSKEITDKSTKRKFCSKECYAKARIGKSPKYIF